jgi:hypothetical protein
MPCSTLTFRRAIPEDWEGVMAVMPVHFELVLEPEAPR